MTKCGGLQLFDYAMCVYRDRPVSACVCLFVCYHTSYVCFLYLSKEMKVHCFFLILFLAQT